MWANICDRLLEHIRSKLERDVRFNADDFADTLADLPAELVNRGAYEEAAAAGAAAVGVETTIDDGDVARRNAQRVARYARRVPDRIALSLATFLNDVQVDNTDLDSIYESVNAKLEALGSDVSRYAEPPWGAGNESYGRQLGDFEIMVDWVLDDGIDDHCDDCMELADEGPYDSDTIPTWPGQGDTACLDRCHCSIVADDETWQEHFPAAA